MILPWLTSFSALIVCGAALAVGADLTGTIEVAGAHKAAASNAGVAVWLEPEAPLAPLSAPLPMARMIQQNKRFVPHVLAIPVGTTVDFPNYDPIYHNAFSNIEGQPFDLGLYPPGTSRRVLFNRSGVVRIFCNIHQSMSAVIVVAPSPWVAVTASDGSYAIRNVPPGRYTLRLFHERATAATLDALARKIAVRDDMTLPRLVVSEAGHIEMPHKNKYGHDYAPDSPAYGNKP